MEYAVLIERKQEGWRAFIPALADLGAEGYHVMKRCRTCSERRKRIYQQSKLLPSRSICHRNSHGDREVHGRY